MSETFTPLSPKFTDDELALLLDQLDSEKRRILPSEIALYWALLDRKEIQEEREMARGDFIAGVHEQFAFPKAEKLKACIDRWDFENDPANEAENNRINQRAVDPIDACLLRSIEAEDELLGEDDVAYYVKPKKSPISRTVERMDEFREAMVIVRGSFLSKHGCLPSEAEAWSEIINNPPRTTNIEVRTDHAGMKYLAIDGKEALTRQRHKDRFRRLYGLR